MKTYYILTAEGETYFCKWSDSAEIYYSYLQSKGKVNLTTTNIFPYGATELIVEDFVVTDFKHYELGGKELIEGTILGTINIHLLCEVSRDYTTENEWYISNEYCIIKGVSIPADYSSTIREMINEQIRELEDNGYLETNRELCYNDHDNDAWKESNFYLNRHN